MHKRSERLTNHVDFLIDLLFLPEERLYVERKSGYQQIDLEILLDLARRNRVLSISLSRLLDSFGPELSNDDKLIIEKSLYECNKRSEEALRLFSLIQEALKGSRIGFTAFKTFDDYPNIPSEDIDILVSQENLEQAKKAILGMTVKPFLYEKGPLAYLGESKEKRHFHFNVESLNFEVELYPELTVLGENYLTAEEIIRNSQYVEVDGCKILLPSPEDTLLIICMHTIFKHGGLIRLPDIYTAVRLIKSADLNWQYIFNRAYDKGMMRGLIYFLAVINNFYARFGKTLFTDETIHHLSFFDRRVNVNEIPHRIPVPALLSVYFYKVFSDLYKFRWHSALKTFQTCIFKTVGRMLFFITRKTNRSIAKWGVGVELGVKLLKSPLTT